MEHLPNQCRRSWKLPLAAALALAATTADASEPLTHPRDIMGTMSCTAGSCHGGGGPRYWSDSAKGAEYVHWLGASPTFSDGRRDYDPRARLVKPDGDPHARSAQRMLEPRFQEVLRRASGQPDGSVGATMLAKCAKCHDPHRSPHAPREESITPSMMPTAGINCETCHGGARQWLAVHYQTSVTRDELSRLGMVDTKNLLVRAKLCASCHVGSAENDMNHDMIAAGHPPLRFEQASYEALLGRKHWDDAPARAADGNYEVRLWTAGRIAAATAALELLKVRSQGSEASEEKPWPELAESNCLACHQPLRREGTQKVDLGLLANRSAVVPWQSWNTALVQIALPAAAPSINELPQPNSDWRYALEQLRGEMQQSAIPNTRRVAAWAIATKIFLHQQVASDHLPVTALSVLESFGEIDREASWDELCQRVAALVAIKRSLEDQGKLSGQMVDDVKRRLERLATALRFTQANREWPVLFSDRSPLSRAEVSHDLSRLRDELLREARR